MSPEEEKQLQEMVDRIAANTDDRTLAMMVMMAHRIGVLESVVATDSVDVDACAEWLYHDRNHVVPLDHMKEIVTEHIPVLSQEGLIVDGHPTEEAKEIAAFHQMVRHEGHVSH